MILDLLNDSNSSDNVFSFQVSKPKFTITFDIIRENYSDRAYVAVQPLKGIMVLCKDAHSNIWHNADLSIRENQEIPIDLSIYLDETDLIDVIIYGPLYDTLTKLSIECESGHILENKGEKFCVIGGSDTLGIGCTTSALKFSNILQRKNNITIIPYVHSQENYIQLVTNQLITQEQNNYIIELNNSININEFITFIKSLKYNFMFIWYYNVESDKIRQLQEKLGNNLLLYNQTGNTTYLTDKILLCDISSGDKEFFNEFCTINYEKLNDSGNIMLYKLIQKVLED